ncbi:MAG: hypothetical protein HQL27_01760 [Candidatus Omnitrophica bacterium]|nr:hypothetical protein [Candidatus Omnitrophota bacterium]
MSVFYDPKIRKPKPWIMVVIVLIPVIITFLMYSGAKTLAEKKKQDRERNATPDIFQK